MDEITSISDKIQISTHSPRFSDGDPAGIVYFANYPMYFDEAFIKIAKTHGFDWSTRVNHEKKFIIPIVEQKAIYKRPLSVGQPFYVATAIIHIGNRSFRSGHILFTKNKDDIVLGVHGYISRVAVNQETFTAITVPNELEQALNQYLVTEYEWEAALDVFQN